MDLGFPSPHLDMPGLGQGFKAYNRWILLTILIKIWGMALTWAIYSLTEYAEKNQKNSVISAGSARGRENMDN